MYDAVLRAWRGSAIIGLVASLWGKFTAAVRRAFQNSAIARFFAPVFTKFDMFGDLREHSVLLSLLKKPYDSVLFLSGALYRGFSRAWPLKYLAKLIDYLCARLATVSAVIVTLILCVDDAYWNNFYMLLAAIFVSALYIIKLAKEDHPRRHGIPVSLYVFILCMAFAVTRGPLMADSIRVYTFFLSAFAFMFCIAGSIHDMRDFRRVFLILFAAVLFNSFTAIFQSIDGVAVETSYTDIVVNAGLPGRVYASLYNPNNLAEVLILLVPCCFISMFKSPEIKPSARFVLMASLLIPIAALVLTYSRSSWIAFAIIVAAFIALANVRYIPLMIVLGLMALPVLPYSIRNRILTLFSGEDTSVGYRLYIWEGSLVTLRHNPILGNGLGPGNFYRAYQKFMLWEAMVASHSHNLFLEIWLEGGLAAFASFVFFYLSTLKSTLVTAFRSRPEVKYAAIAVFSALFGVIAVAMVEYIWFYPRVLLTFWVIDGMAWALVRVARETA